MLYMILLDGKICGEGLEWKQALIDAGRLVDCLTEWTDEEAVVTVSEQQLGDPQVTWHRVGSRWDFHALPIWDQAA